MTELEKAARFLSPETIPVTVSVLPAAWLRNGDELRRLANEYPQFFSSADLDISSIKYKMPERYHSGTFTDEWGCVWSNIHEGNDSIVTGHPIKSEEDIFDLKIPDARGGILPHGFFYLRLLDLCGFELAMELFAEEGEALKVLIEKVKEFNKIQIDDVLATGQRGWFSFGDDLGMQKGLAIGPERWRRWLKPAFKEMYGLIYAEDPDAAIYMHTDGCIYEIIPDLAECGVTMVNPQFRANGLDNLVRVCRSEHRIALHLDLDRQMFPLATPSELDSHVKECIEALYLKEGGLGISCEFNYDVPINSAAAILEALEKYRHYKG